MRRMGKASTRAVCRALDVLVSKWPAEYTPAEAAGDLTACGIEVFWSDEDECFRPLRVCRVCGCNDLDCSRCIERTGQLCHWVERDLCSACVGEGSQR